MQIYSKRTGKPHQSLVISTLEYILKEKRRKTSISKKYEGVFKRGKSTLKVAKTLNKIEFFKEKSEKDKNRVLNTLCTLFFFRKKSQETQEKSLRENLGGKRTIKSNLFCSTFSAKTSQ